MSVKIGSLVIWDLEEFSLVVSEDESKFYTVRETGRKGFLIKDEFSFTLEHAVEIVDP